jgi:hypothetical protein
MASQGTGNGEERGINWERFLWNCAGTRYLFEVQSGGLHGQLRSDAGHSLTLPMVAWEGLLDCVRAQRKARTQTAAVDLPARAGARWTSAESDELRDGYKAGKTVAQLAAQHSRTRGAIRSELERLGLIVSPYAGSGQAHPAFAPYDGVPVTQLAAAPLPNASASRVPEDARRG